MVLVMQRRYTGQMFGKSVFLLITLSVALGCQVQQRETAPEELVHAPTEEDQGKEASTEKREPPIQEEKSAPRSTSVALINHLWNSPIGELFGTYISAPGGTASTSHIAEMIAQRVFSDPNLVLPRIEALRILVADLYDSRVAITETTQSRIQVLHLTLERDRVALESHERNFPSIYQVLPYIVGVSFLSGSRELRHQLWVVTQRVYRYFIRAEATRLPSTSLMQLMGPKLFHQYSPHLAYMTFMHSVMAYMILEEFAGAHGNMKMPADMSGLQTHLLDIDGL